MSGLTTTFQPYGSSFTLLGSHPSTHLVSQFPTEVPDRCPSFLSRNPPLRYPGGDSSNNPDDLESDSGALSISGGAGGNAGGIGGTGGNASNPGGGGGSNDGNQGPLQFRTSDIQDDIIITMQLANLSKQRLNDKAAV